MPLDLDPIYHTETMVKILREQGSAQYALELAEKILKNNPTQESVKKIWGELKEDMRKAFERFRQGGRAPTAARDSEEDEDVQPQTEISAPSSPIEFVPIEFIPAEPKVLSTQDKIHRLQRLLIRVQDARVQ